MNCFKLELLVGIALLCLTLTATAAEPEGASPGSTPAGQELATTVQSDQEVPVAPSLPTADATPAEVPTPVTPPSVQVAPVVVPSLPPTPRSAPQDEEKKRLASSMLDFFETECSPLTRGQKESGMFDIFSDDKNPVLSKCLDDLTAYVQSFWGLPDTARALNLIAALNKAQANAPAEVVALGKLIYVFDDSEWRSKAESRLLGLAIKELKEERPLLKQLAKGSDLADRGERYFQFIQDLAKFNGTPFMTLLRQECDSFFERFPGHPKTEMVLEIKAESLLREKRFVEAFSGYRQLVGIYPDSPLRSARLLVLGGGYDDQLKQYERAVGIFEQIIAEYPEHGAALTAYQRAARTYEKNLARYQKAVETLDQIVQRYPENEAALQALQDQARIYTAHIGNFYAAIKTYQRLADMFPGDAAVTALVRAAELARKNIEDFDLQIELQQRLVSEYPDREESIAALYSSAETFEENLRDPAQAIATYQLLIDTYPDHKLVNNAKKRIQKLTAKK